MSNGSEPAYAYSTTHLANILSWNDSNELIWIWQNTMTDSS